VKKPFGTRLGSPDASFPSRLRDAMPSESISQSTQQGPMSGKPTRLSRRASRNSRSFRKTRTPGSNRAQPCAALKVERTRVSGLNCTSPSIRPDFTPTRPAHCSRLRRMREHRQRRPEPQTRRSIWGASNHDDRLVTLLHTCVSTQPRRLRALHARSWRGHRYGLTSVA
jgi:hypothetical protein